LVATKIQERTREIYEGSAQKGRNRRGRVVDEIGGKTKDRAEKLCESGRPGGIFEGKGRESVLIPFTKEPIGCSAKFEGGGRGEKET